MRVCQRAADDARDHAAEPLHHGDAADLDGRLLTAQGRGADDVDPAQPLVKPSADEAEVVGTQRLLAGALDDVVDLLALGVVVTLGCLARLERRLGETLVPDRRGRQADVAQPDDADARALLESLQNGEVKAKPR